MILSKLNINNLRNISKLHLSPETHLNIISGQNGAGKSSILEAIYLLVRNRSFRKTSINNLIKDNKQYLKISAQFKNNDGYIQNLDLTKSPSYHHLLINGQEQNKLASVAQKLPLGIITPNIHRIIDEGPTHRRRLLDWGVFHVEPYFASLIRDYKKILLQRNAALQGNLQFIHLWDNQLDSISNVISEKRLQNTKEIKKILYDYTKKFFPRHEVEVKYNIGWESKLSLYEALRINLNKDKKRGYTTIGPHRADLSIKVDGKLAKDILSRGELKILAILIVLSNLVLIKTKANDSPLLLCDDIFSELDDKNLVKLIELILKENFQTFITTLRGDFYDIHSGDCKMFHVEHGEIV